MNPSTVSVRGKAKTLLELLNDRKAIRRERQKAKNQLPFIVGAKLLRPDRMSMFIAVGVVSLTNLLIHTPKLADASARLQGRMHEVRRAQQGMPLSCLVQRGLYTWRKAMMRPQNLR